MSMGPTIGGLRRIWRCAAAAFLLAGSAPLWADVAGSVIDVTGSATARTPAGATRALAIKSEVAEGELIVTGADSYLRIRFKDGAEITLRPRSQLRVETYAYKEADPQSDNIFLNLLKGGLRTVTGLVGRRRPIAYRMDAGSATIGIRGTNYGALVCLDDCAGLQQLGGGALRNGLHVDVADGAVLVSNEHGQVLLSAGQHGFVASTTAVPQSVPAAQGIEVQVPQSMQPGSAAPAQSSGAASQSGGAASQSGGAATGAGAPAAASGAQLLVPGFAAFGFGVGAGFAGSVSNSSASTHH